MSSEEPNDTMPKVDLRSDVEIVEKSFVADGTTGTYIGVLVRILVFLFDNHPLSIESSVLEELKDENEKDVIVNAAAQGRRTRKKKLKRPHLADDSKRKNLRRACRTFCENMKPSINRSAYVSPFIIKGDNQITYEMLRDFMLMKKNIVSIKTETAHKCMQTMKKEVPGFDDEAIFDHDKIDV